jgi:16S rRNA processing protein RimM
VKKEYFELGRVLKPQGIRGEVKIDAYTDDMGRFAYLDHVYIKQDSEMRKVAVQSKRADKTFAYLKLEGTDDRNAAEALRGTILFIDRQNAAQLPEGSYYIEDMIGLLVVDTKGNELGRLCEIIKTGGTDVFRVESTRGILMFPSVPHVVLHTDVESGRILVDAESLKEVCVYDDL